MPVLGRFDGLAVVEQALGLDVEACRPPYVAVPHPGPCKDWRKKSATIQPRTKAARGESTLFSPSKPLTAEQKAELFKAYSGTFGDLTAKPTQITRDRQKGKLKLNIEGKIYGPGQDPNDPSEVGVGDFTRELLEENGQRIAIHDLLALDPEVQGQGFATLFNQQAMAWYRDNDVARVRLHANIDVGGIAWARAGWDFETKQDSIKVEERILRTLTEMANNDRPAPTKDDKYPPQWWKIPAQRRREQAQAAIEMRRRLISGKFGEDDYPTPYEISELGRWPGARLSGDTPGDEGDWWIGRAIMTGSEWDGGALP